jgi:hypothetical protein
LQVNTHAQMDPAGILQHYTQPYPMDSTSTPIG